MISFKEPLFFILILILPFINRIYRKKKADKITVSFLSLVKKEGKKVKTKKMFYYVYLFSILLLIIALTRPSLKKVKEKKFGSGIDIFVALDISGSMASEDYQPKNRVEVAKEVINNFIKKREEDKIGLILFAGQAVVRAPLTFSHQILTDIIKDVRIGMIEDGTAIGMAIAIAVKHLMSEKAKAKTIILLTDGVNNKGEISPKDAAKLAKKLGIKIYIIGVGKKGKALFPISNEFGEKEYVKVEVKIDEPLMKKMAEMTEGRYFRAENSKQLENIFRTIDREERQSSYVTREVNNISLAPFFVGIAFILLIICKFFSLIYLAEVP